MDTPVEKVFGRIVGAMDAWEQANTKEKMQEEVFATLNQARDEIVRKLLGFNKAWGGKWEIDHCNGRAGNSPAGEYLYNNLKPAVDAWLSQVTLPKMTEAFRKKIEGQMQAEFERRITEKSWQYAQAAAEEQLEEIKKILLKTDIVEKYKRLQALIDPTTGASS